MSDDDLNPHYRARELRELSRVYLRQSINWLGLGSAGAVVALLSFSANLDEPDHALRALLPAMAALIVSIILCGIIQYMAVYENLSAESHYNRAGRRDSAKVTARQLLAVTDPATAQSRDAEAKVLFGEASRLHEAAQTDWKKYTRLQTWRKRCLAVAGAGFLIGIGYPLLLVGLNVKLQPAKVEAPRPASQSIAGAPAARAIPPPAAAAPQIETKAPPSAKP
jgi:hypothetical protein